MKYAFIILLSFLCINLYALQSPTIGLKWNTEESYNGYTLFSPMSIDTTFLIDNCGYIINQWNFDKRPYYTAYLLENGDLARISIENSGGRYLERQDWEGNLLWSYRTLPDDNELIHSDFQVLENGNVLVITAKRYPQNLFFLLGGNPDDLNGFSDPLFERFVEYEPIGSDSATVVWQWSFIEHLIQDISDTLPNYGNIATNPQLLNINHPPGVVGHSPAYQHFNGMDYNSELDQIVFSCWGCSEIYIIDHSTTMLEASGHSGGNSGKGGDLLWRWGNPRNYNQGDSTDQMLFGQHNPTWLGEDTPYPGYMSVHDNGNGRPEGEFSRAVIISQNIDSAGNYIMENNTYLPDSIFWSWNGEVDDSVYYSKYMSTIDIQPNGNALICEAGSGRIFEVTPDGTVVWLYQNPVTSEVLTQGSPPTTFSRVYRADKYSPDYPAFADRDLSAQGIIEDLNWISDSCHIYENPIIIDTMVMDTSQIDTTVMDTTMIDTMAIDTTMMDTLTSTGFEIIDRSYLFPNPSSGRMWVEGVLGEMIHYAIKDLNGRKIYQTSSRDNFISLDNIPSGTYIIQSFTHNYKLNWSEKIIIIH